MTNNSFPAYVSNFKCAYDALHTLYLTDDVFAFVNPNGIETPEFLHYVKAVREVVRTKMHTPKSFKSAANTLSCKDMVEALRASGEYTFESTLGTDDILDILVSKILEAEITKQYFLNKHDAGWAFRSISRIVYNQLCDMMRKLPSPPQKAGFKTVSLDSEIIDEKGRCTTFGSVTADPRQNTEQDVLLSEILNYAKFSFVHEVAAALIQNKKPHYLLAYLNNIAGRSGIELYTDIVSLGYTQTIRQVTSLLKEMGIDMDYLNNTAFHWKKDPQSIGKNLVHNWLDEGCKVARKHYTQRCL